MYIYLLVVEKKLSTINEDNPFLTTLETQSVNHIHREFKAFLEHASKFFILHRKHFLTKTGAFMSFKESKGILGNF